FGSSVALSADGTRLAVGAERDDGAGNAVSDSGAVYLFSFTDTAFSGGALQATLGKGYTGGKNVDVAALGTGDLFGSSVALSADGTRLAVGAERDDGAGNAVSDSGAVYLFSFTDTSFSGGQLVGTIGKGYTATAPGLDVSALGANDWFGVSVALSANGTRLAVGALNDDGAGNAVTDSGAVYLFSFTDTAFSGGTLQATLGKGYTGGKNVDVAALESSDQFGGSVALSADGTRLAVGAFEDDGAGNAVANSGAVYLFTEAGTDSPTPIAGNNLFSNGPSADVTFLPSTLTTLLNAGNAVVLQANNDITVNSPITVTPATVGGTLTLQAGRSILINANVTTGNGGLNLWANDPGAVSDRDAGAANVTMAAGTTIDAGTGTVSVEIRNGSTAGTATLRSITAASLNLRADDVAIVPGSTISGTGNAFISPFTTARPIAIGTANQTGALGLDAAELAAFSGYTVLGIGGTGTGAVTVGGAVALSRNTSIGNTGTGAALTLQGDAALTITQGANLQAGGTLTQQAGATINATNSSVFFLAPDDADFVFANPAAVTAQNVGFQSTFTNATLGLGTSTGAAYELSPAFLNGFTGAQGVIVGGSPTGSGLVRIGGTVNLSRRASLGNFGANASTEVMNGSTLTLGAGGTLQSGEGGALVIPADATVNAAGQFLRLGTYGSFSTVDFTNVSAQTLALSTPRAADDLEVSVTPSDLATIKLTVTPDKINSITTAKVPNLVVGGWGPGTPNGTVYVNGEVTINRPITIGNSGPGANLVVVSGTGALTLGGGGQLQAGNEIRVQGGASISAPGQFLRLGAFDGFLAVDFGNVTAQTLALSTPFPADDIEVAETPTGQTSVKLTVRPSIINSIPDNKVPNVLVGGWGPGTTNGSVYVSAGTTITRPNVTIGNTGTGSTTVVSGTGAVSLGGGGRLQAGGQLTQQAGSTITSGGSITFAAGSFNLANPGGITASNLTLTGAQHTDTVGVGSGTGAITEIATGLINALTGPTTLQVNDGQGETRIGGAVSIGRSGVTVGSFDPASATTVLEGASIGFGAGGTLRAGGALTLQPGSAVAGGAGTLALTGYDIALMGGAGSITGGGNPATSRLEIYPHGLGRNMFIGAAGGGTVIDATELQTIGGGFDNSVLIGSGTATTIGGVLGTLAVGNGPWFFGSSSSNTVLASGLRIDGTTGNGALFFYGSTVTQQADAKATAGTGGIGLRGNSFDLQGVAGDLATTGDIFIRAIANDGEGRITVGNNNGNGAPTLVTQATLDKLTAAPRLTIGRGHSTTEETGGILV
ncbi:MAG: beta strand repeat-containing protein, partial [Rhodospirillales bacterium]